VSINFQLDYMNERELPKLPDDFDPKFGKIDPTGAPHVGGNTWAGGSGKGSCTLQ
jgi:hypothetical protein